MEQPSERKKCDEATEKPTVAERKKSHEATEKQPSQRKKSHEATDKQPSEITPFILPKADFTKWTDTYLERKKSDEATENQLPSERNKSDEATENQPSERNKSDGATEKQLSVRKKLVYIPTDKSWCKAAWWEKDRINGGTIPRSWVSKSMRTVLWPPSGTDCQKFIDMCVRPVNQQKWKMFRLKHCSHTVQSLAEARELQTDVMVVTMIRTKKRAREEEGCKLLQEQDVGPEVKAANSAWCVSYESDSHSPKDNSKDPPHPPSIVPETEESADESASSQHSTSSELSTSSEQSTSTGPNITARKVDHAKWTIKRSLTVRHQVS